MRYHIPMMVFYRMNPRMIERYQPYMNEWLKERVSDESLSGWVHGMYISRVLGPIMDRNAEAYPESPVDLTKPRTEVDDGEEVYEFNDADRFGAFAMVFNKQFEDREDNPSEDPTLGSQQPTDPD